MPLLLVAPIIKQEKKEKRALFVCDLSSVLFLVNPIEIADVGSGLTAVGVVVGTTGIKVIKLLTCKIMHARSVCAVF